MIEFFLWWLLGVISGMAIIIVILSVKKDLLAVMIKTELRKKKQRSS